MSCWQQDRAISNAGGNKWELADRLELFIVHLSTDTLRFLLSPRFYARHGKPLEMKGAYHLGKELKQAHKLLRWKEVALEGHWEGAPWQPGSFPQAEHPGFRVEVSCSLLLPYYSISHLMTQAAVLANSREKQRLTKHSWTAHCRAVIVQLLFS